MNLQEQLDQINNAIKAIECGAQEYRIGNRSLRRPDLLLLYKERRLLQQEMAGQNDGSISVAVFDRR